MAEQIIGMFFEIKETGCQHGILISQQQSVIEEQTVRLNDLEKQLRQLEQRLAAADALEPTFVSPFASWDSVVKLVSAKDGSEYAAEDPWFHRVDCCPVSAEGAVYRVQCHMCEDKTFVCAQVQNDTDQRTTCLGSQGWTKSESTRKWRRRDCTRRYYYPQRMPEWALICCESIQRRRRGWGR